MSDPAVELERVRRITSEALMEHFAEERLPLEEFEDRVRAVREADSVSELRRLLGGLGRLGGPPGEASPSDPRGAPDASSTLRLHASPESVSSRHHAHRVVSFAGVTELDLCGRIGPGDVAEVRVLATTGRVEIVVPPGATVDVSVGGLGARVRVDAALARQAAGQAGPFVRITGWTVLGSVYVTEGSRR